MQPPVVFQVHPVCAAQVVELVRLLQDADPLQVPAGPVAVQPGMVAHEDDEQVEYDGVPVHRGPGEKVCVAAGSRVSADLQQICPEQSLLVSHVFGQDLLHMPLQQSSPFDVLQSVDVEHSFGHAV